MTKASSPGLRRGQRRALLQWGGWFAALNALLMGLLAIRYFVNYSPPDQAIALVYTALAYIGHFSLLAFTPYLALVLPLTLLIPWRPLIVTLSVVVFSACLTLLSIDTLVFSEHNFHVNALTASILGGKTRGFAAIYFLIALVFECVLSGWTWRTFAAPSPRKTGLYLGGTLFSCLLASQLLYIWGDARYDVGITKLNHHLPLYYRLTAKRFLAAHGLVDLQQSRERQLVNRLGRDEGEMLNYPLHPLQCEPPRPMMNVLLILIDAMRHDMLAPRITPHLARFAEQALRYESHYSGGNSSRMGVFSLFYALPSTYWESFHAVQKTPLLMDAFKHYGYQLGIFASASLSSPTGLDRTAFAAIPQLRTRTRAQTPFAYAKDRKITEEWMDWVDGRDPEKPFFGFLFYDSPTASDFPPEYERLFPIPAEGDERGELLHRYQISLHFVDSLIAQVLDHLKARHLMDDTVIIVTSDHGEEFDDSGLGYWEHGSAYTRFQVHTPMILYWPGVPPRTISRRTSHFDIAPTLLHKVFNCSNPPSDYSSGKSLFSEKGWTWLIIGSYDNDAVVEPDQITVTYPGGYFDVRDRDYRILKRPVIRSDIITRALQETSRFYRNPAPGDASE